MRPDRVALRTKLELHIGNSLSHRTGRCFWLRERAGYIMTVCTHHYRSKLNNVRPVVHKTQQAARVSIASAHVLKSNSNTHREEGKTISGFMDKSSKVIKH